MEKYVDYSKRAVPKNARLSTYAITTTFAAAAVAIYSLILGAQITTSLSLQKAIVAVLLGNVVLNFLGGYMGSIGARTGATLAMLCRHAFGRHGSKFVSLALAFVLLGWFSVQITVFGSTVAAMFPKGGFLTQSLPAAMWGGFLMILTAWIGFKGIAFLSKLALPSLVFLTFYGLFKAGIGDGEMAKIFNYVPANEKSIWAMMSLVISQLLTGALIMPDFTRYAKDDKAVWIATSVSFIPIVSTMTIAGGVLGIVAGDGNLPVILVKLGVGLLGLLILVLAQWTTNDSNLYLASNNMANIFNWPKRYIVLAGGAFALLSNVFGWTGNYVKLLLFIGVVLPPVMGVLLADFYVVSKDKYKFGQGTQYAEWQFAGLLSWLCGATVGRFVNVGVPSLNSLVSAFILYLLLTKTFKTKGSYGKYIETKTGF